MFLRDNEVNGINALKDVAEELFNSAEVRKSGSAEGLEARKSMKHKS